MFIIHEIEITLKVGTIQRKLRLYFAILLWCRCRAGGGGPKRAAAGAGCCGTSGLEPGSGQCRGGGETMDTSDREQDTNTSNYTTNITRFIKVSRKLYQEENIQKCFQSSYTEYCQLL